MSSALHTFPVNQIWCKVQTHVAYTMPMLVLLQSKSDLEELTNCFLSTDLELRGGDKQLRNLPVVTNKTLWRTVRNVFRASGAIDFSSKLITGWRRSQSPAVRASWWEGPPGW